MVVIGITGMPACGKSLFASIAEKKGYRVFDLSSVLKEILKKEGKEISSDNLSALAKKLRKEKGMDIVAKKLCKIVPKKGKIIVSGFRSYEEIEYLRKRYPALVMISIITPQSKRMELSLSHAKYGISSKKKFGERDRKDLDLGLGRCILLSDRFIFNDSSKTAFAKKTEQMINKIESEKNGSRS